MKTIFVLFAVLLLVNCIRAEDAVEDDTDKGASDGVTGSTLTSESGTTEQAAGTKDSTDGEVVTPEATSENPGVPESTGNPDNLNIISTDGDKTE